MLLAQMRNMIETLIGLLKLTADILENRDAAYYVELTINHLQRATASLEGVEAELRDGSSD